MRAEVRFTAGTDRSSNPTVTSYVPPSFLLPQEHHNGNVCEFIENV